MKAKEAARLSTLRLISAAIKDREIAARTEGGEEAGLSDADLTAILSKMVKQRQESAKAYEEGGRLELAEREQDEIKVIQSYLPRQLDAEETRAAIDKAIADLAPSRSATWAGSWPSCARAMPGRWISAPSVPWSRTG